MVILPFTLWSGGYPKGQATWEPAAHLDQCPAALRAWRRRFRRQQFSAGPATAIPFPFQRQFYFAVIMIIIIILIIIIIIKFFVLICVSYLSLYHLRLSCLALCQFMFSIYNFDYYLFFSPILQYPFLAICHLLSYIISFLYHLKLPLILFL